MHMHMHMHMNMHMRADFRSSPTVGLNQTNQAYVCGGETAGEKRLGRGGATAAQRGKRAENVTIINNAVMLTRHHMLHSTTR